MMTYAVLIAAAFFAGIVQTSTGFGAAVVMMTFLPFFMEVPVAAALSCAVCAGLATTLCLRFRRYIDLKMTAVPVLAYLIASMAAIRLQPYLNIRLLTVLFGSFLILLAVYLAFFSEKARIPANLGAAVPVSLFSGTTNGLFGIGGPLMAAYFVSAADSKERYIAATQFLFAVTNLVNTGLRAVQGTFTLSLLPLTAAGIVSVMLGKRVGLKLLDRINARTLKRAVFILIALSGTVTVIKAL